MAAQARNAALQAGQGIQTGVKGAAESVNKFIEGQDEGAAKAGRRVEPEKKDFWDSFGAPAVENEAPASSIGTSAMRKTTGQTKAPAKSKEDGWGDDW